MNVLAVTPLYPPESRVGAWLSTHEFLVGLVGRGHHVEVVAYMMGTAGYRVDGIQVHPRRDDLYDRADIVVSHLGDNQQAATQARARRIPSVRMAHGADHVDRERLDGAALVVCNSEATRVELAWDGPTIVLHPPVWPDRYRTVPGDMVTQINICPLKGGDLFWRIAQGARHRPFLAVKGGYGKQRVSKLPNLTVMENTPDMISVYQKTKILLVPSTKESWGRVGIEAMHSGIPVIAAPTPGLLESLGPAGIFVPTEDATGWLEEIERLHDPDEWAAASARALARVETLDPAADVARFVDAVENLAQVAA